MLDSQIYISSIFKCFVGALNQSRTDDLILTMDQVKVTFQMTNDSIIPNKFPLYG